MQKHDTYGWVHTFFQRKYAWCKCNSEKLNTKYFQQGQLSLIQKGYRRPNLEIKHMTWTYDPKSDPKKTLKVVLTDIDANISISHIYCLATSCLIAS